MTDLAQDPPPQDVAETRSEYDVIGWPLSWGGASILTFCLAFTYANNTDYSRGWIRAWVETSIILLVGLLFGIIGRRRDEKRFPALVGNLLNGGILLTFLTVAVAFLVTYFQIL